MEQLIQLRKENIADDNTLHFASIGGKETALVIERSEYSSEVIRWARYWCNRLNPSVYAHFGDLLQSRLAYFDFASSSLSRGS